MNGKKRPKLGEKRARRGIWESLEWGEEGQNDVLEGNCHTIKKDIQSGSLRESTQSINPFLSDVVVFCKFICVHFFLISLFWKY